MLYNLLDEKEINDLNGRIVSVAILLVSALLIVGLPVAGLLVADLCTCCSLTFFSPACCIILYEVFLLHF
jgi:hypothetical protein